MKVDLAPCAPPLWARGGHSQTLWAQLIPSPSYALPGEKIVIALPDGDSLIGTFHAGTSDSVVYLFHGLGGDISSDYMRRTTQVAFLQGHSVYLLNHRGCGEGEGLAVAPYHSGRAEDLSEVLKVGRARYPGNAATA